MNFMNLGDVLYCALFREHILCEVIYAFAFPIVFNDAFMWYHILSVVFMCMSVHSSIGVLECLVCVYILPPCVHCRGDSSH